MCVYIISSEAYKKAVPATTLPGCPFTLCTMHELSSFPPFCPSLPALLHPSEPIKRKEDNELHNDNFCIIVSLSGSMPSAMGTIRKGEEDRTGRARHTYGRKDEEERM